MKKGLIKTFKDIRKNKILFLLAIFLQLIFLISIFTVGIKYQLDISEDIKVISLSLNNANYNSSSIDQGTPFMQDLTKEMGKINQSYQNMINSIFLMVVLLLLSFLILNGFVWNIVISIVKRKFLIKPWIRYAYISLIFMIPLILIIYLTLNSLITSTELIIKIGTWFLVIMTVLGFYLMILSFCFLDKKNPLKNVYRLGIKKITIIFFVFLITLILPFLGIYIAYLSQLNFYLMTLGFVIILVALILGKIFLINTVRFINRKTMIR